MKNYTITRWGSALTMALAAMLSLTSCGDDNEPPSPPTETARIAFYVKGVVTNQEGTPLEGINMKVMEDYKNKFGFVLLDAVKTDEEGAYQTNVISDATINDGMVLVAEDPAGNYLPDTVALTELSKRQVGVGDDMRDKGRWELTANARLRKAK